MTLYNLQKSTSDTNHVLLPESLFFKLNNYKKISLGTEICSCKVSCSTDDHTIYLAPSIWDQLGVPYESQVHVIANDGIIHIGPLIGIFTAGFTGSILRPIGDRSLFFAKILSSEKKVGAFTFVFGANHINWETGKIKGLFHSSGGWQQIEVPFPNVVYDRLPNRKTENHDKLRDIKNRLKTDYLIPWFNPGFFNKWDIHQIFREHLEVKHFLPETIINPTIDSIKELLTKYRSIYIKPINGSLGLGIHQIINPIDEDKWYCRFRKNDKNYLRKYNTLESLLHHQFKADILEGYLAQQGISLVRIEDKPIDFRIHTNKDEKGQWKMSAIAAKVAGSGSVTTHLGSGGSVKTIDEIIKKASFPINLATNLEQAVLTMSHVLEKQMRDTIGEIGFDIGVDTKGEIWLFEANSKPGRSIFKHPKLKEFDHLSRTLPISYGIYLTKKAIYQPEVLFNG